MIKKLALSLGILFILFYFALTLGRYPASGYTLLTKLLSDNLSTTVLLSVRLPRVILAVLGGAALATSGYVFQMIFGNPLVEPGFLGVSQGSAFGAALAIFLLPYSSYLVQLSASLFGLIGLFMSYSLSRKFKFGGSILRLVLAGIAVSSIFSAALSLIKLASSPSSKLQDITFWLMGGLYNSSWQTLLTVFPPIGLALVLLYLFRWRVNLLSLDDKTAHSMGVNVKRDKTLLLIVSTIATTSFISVSGLVGWVGLIVPHLGRAIFGSDGKYALPGTMLFGSMFLLASDTLARSLLPTEIPLGVVTSLFGSFVFIVILSKGTFKVKV
jgi:iron complex transport system permease protein